MALPDYHMHTPLCKHASGDPAAYKEAAERRGIPEICFSDHSPNPDGFDPGHRMELDQFILYRERVEGIQDQDGPTVLMGIEADYYEGCESFLRQWLPAQGFDLVIGSVHYIDGWGFDNPSYGYLWDAADVKAVWGRYFKLVEGLALTGLFDSVGHLDLPKKFGHRLPDQDLREMVRPVLDHIARTGMGMEINTSGLTKPVKEIYPSPLILDLARAREIPICFGSDAHSPDHVGFAFDAALTLAREAGYTYYFRIRDRKKELLPLP